MSGREVLEQGLHQLAAVRRNMEVDDAKVLLELFLGDVTTGDQAGQIARQGSDVDFGGGGHGVLGHAVRLAEDEEHEHGFIRQACGAAGGYEVQGMTDGRDHGWRQVATTMTEDLARVDGPTGSVPMEKTASIFHMGFSAMSASACFCGSLTTSADRRMMDPAAP